MSQAHPDAAVVGQTNTTNAHDRLRSIGVRPVVKDLNDDAPQKFPYVVFCAPPSGSDDYAAEVRSAHCSNSVLAPYFTSACLLFGVE